MKKQFCIDYDGDYVIEMMVLKDMFNEGKIDRSELEDYTLLGKLHVEPTNTYPLMELEDNTVCICYEYSVASEDDETRIGFFSIIEKTNL